MKLTHRLQQSAAWLALASLSSTFGVSQAPGALAGAHGEAREVALPLPEDRGAAALEQTLKHLGTWASLMMIVAHPDDEDGAMMTYEGRGLGVRTDRKSVV